MSCYTNKMAIVLWRHFTLPITSLCPASYVNWRRDTVRVRCRAPAVQRSIDIFCPPGPQQQTRCSGERWPNDVTDRRTDARQFHRRCSAYYASSVDKRRRKYRSGVRFTKYLTTILRLSYDNAKVTIDLRRTSNLQNIIRRAQGYSWVRFTCKVVRSCETVFAN